MELSFSQGIKTCTAKLARRLLKLVKMDLSHVNLLATGSCAWTARPAFTILISFSSKSTSIIETIHLKQIGATVTIAILTLTIAARQKRTNVTWHARRETAAIWFAENACRRRTTQKAFLRLIMVDKEEGVEVVEDITKRKND